MENLYGAFGAINKPVDDATGFDSYAEMYDTAKQRGHTVAAMVYNKQLSYFYERATEETIFKK